ncbi:MAG: DUF4386 family protein [Actinobacteria bacterium]|nr:DUF4386 family protein [Actinomycetota bacterium]
MAIDETTESTVTHRLVGNRLMLTGALLYLTEFAGIALSQAQHLPEQPAVDGLTLMRDYAGHADGLGFVMGWFGIVLLGRVLVLVALRVALARSGYRSAWMDLAVVAMAVGVTLEMASAALATAAGQLADAGQNSAAVAIDRGAAYLADAIYAPAGLAVILASCCMYASRLFPRVLAILGMLGGAATLAAGLLSGPSFFDVQDALSMPVFVVWAWMLWAGVLMWLRTPKHSHRLARSEAPNHPATEGL